MSDGGRILVLLVSLACTYYTRITRMLGKKPIDGCQRGSCMCAWAQMLCLEWRSDRSNFIAKLFI